MTGTIVEKPIYEDFRQGDIPHSNASIEKAKLMLNYEPKVSFHDSINKTVMYYKSLL